MFLAKIREKSTGKMRSIRLLGFLLVPMVALILGAASAQGWDGDNGDEVPFEVAKCYFELNNTDGDLGIHCLVDGERWKKLEIEDPRGRQMLNVRVTGRLGRQGLTELFFESAELPFESDDPDEVTLSPERFFRRFPEGWYEIEGITVEGEERESKVYLSQVMPAPPGGIMVSGTEIDPDEVDCDEGEIPRVSGPVIICWDPVLTSHPDLGESGDIEVEIYQLVVEQEDLEIVFSVDLPPGVTEFEIPEDFIELGMEFKFEILVRATNGNQTAIESCFEVE